MFQDTSLSLILMFSVINNYCVNIKGTNKNNFTTICSICHMFTGVMWLPSVTPSFLIKIKCSKWPEWLKWCLWVNLVYPGRAEQIRTAEPGASDWPRAFSTDRWGILNNSGEMRSHDRGAGAAPALQVWAHPRCCGGQVRDPRCGGIKDIILEQCLFSAAVYFTSTWACTSQRCTIPDTPSCQESWSDRPIFSVLF